MAHRLPDTLYNNNQPLADFSQPMWTLFFLFSFSNQLCNGLKYSKMALASINRCPVATYRASGHGLDDPNCSKFLKQWQIEIHRIYKISIFTSEFFLPLAFDKCRTYAVAFLDHQGRILQIFRIVLDAIETVRLPLQNIWEKIHKFHNWYQIKLFHSILFDFLQQNWSKYYLIYGVVFGIWYLQPGSKSASVLGTGGSRPWISSLSSHHLQL